MAGPVEPVLSIENLTITLGGQAIVRDVSFSVAPASWFGLVGVNGSGKTTLLRAIAGRLPVYDGLVAIGGEDLTDHEADRAALVGFAPAPESLPNLLRGGELLQLVAEARSANPREPAAAYAALGIDHLLTRQIGEMSSGMRQRLAIFSALMGAPKLVLLDEPFNWLDPLAAYDFKAALAELVAGGLSVITALHDVGTLASRCDSGMLLDEGAVLKVFDKDALAKGAGDLTLFERDIYELFRAGTPAQA